MVLSCFFYILFFFFSVVIGFGGKLCFLDGYFEFVLLYNILLFIWGGLYDLVFLNFGKGGFGFVFK